MEGNEPISVDLAKVEVRRKFAEFLAGITKLEELVALGRRFLVGFQQQLELLRRPLITETSDLVKSIIKAAETKRVKSYVEAGWINLHDNVNHINDMNMCLDGLQDHLSKAKQIVSELESLMDNVANSLRTEFESSPDLNEIQANASDEVKGESSSMDGEIENTDYASFMAVIYGMVKQDYVMQEKIISSLSLKTSSEELNSYCLMWSLRPFVHDDIIREALRHVS